jgi:hypothetical protein
MRPTQPGQTRISRAERPTDRQQQPRWTKATTIGIPFGRWPDDPALNLACDDDAVWRAGRTTAAVCAAREDDRRSSVQAATVRSPPR